MWRCAAVGNNPEIFGRGEANVGGTALRTVGRRAHNLTATLFSTIAAVDCLLVSSTSACVRQTRKRCCSGPTVSRTPARAGAFYRTRRAVRLPLFSTTRSPTTNGCPFHSGRLRNKQSISGRAPNRLPRLAFVS